VHSRSESFSFCVSAASFLAAGFGAAGLHAVAGFSFDALAGGCFAVVGVSLAALAGFSGDCSPGSCLADGVLHRDFFDAADFDAPPSIVILTLKIAQTKRITQRLMAKAYMQGGGMSRASIVDSPEMRNHVVRHGGGMIR